MGHLLQNTSAYRTVSGYQLSLGLPWYRSLPWSCVEDIEVRINDEVWPFKDLTIIIDGAPVTASELAERWDSYWYLQDRILVRINSDVSPPQQADVCVKMALLLPNVLIENKAALVTTESRKRLQIQELAE
ncbi:DUF6379 domain-containing protein [Arthrobacter sp. NPDC058097]|uniref:C-glycoside deglycosidase beta subunit domain-containing protein n=1 Tax=Arthrobacter sp. NPDC058097 TaxID=3346340 RepID=UPI0036D8343F